jgi:hypothetical protein
MMCRNDSVFEAKVVSELKAFGKHCFESATPWEKVSTQKPIHDIVFLLITSLWRMSTGSVIPLLCSAGSISEPR